MKDRLDLHNELVELLGSNHVYFQPPESIRMVYPCIVYERSGVDSEHADDSRYVNMMRYDIQFITKEPDTNDFIIKMLNAFKYCSYNRHYVYDNLNHEAFTVYY